MQELLLTKQKFLNQFFADFPLEKLEEALSILLKCEGMVIFTGVGKSGLVGKKIAQSMTSTGTRAFFLSPTDALHGDIGIVKEGDVFVILSKSGETAELLNLIPYLRSRNVTIIAFLSKPNSRLAKAVDCALYLPLERELCPYDMAPTTSTTIQTIVGDILTVALMRQKGVTLDQYALSHPAGNIGKKATLSVNDLMVKGDRVPICSKDDRIIETLVELSSKQCGCLLVVSPENVLQGIFTDGDLRRSLLKHGPQALEKPVEELMTKGPRTISENSLARDAIRKMEENQKCAITVMPVVNAEKKLTGLIKLHDILQAGI
ncbi:MAG: KpsF/GutQ family sugar-phosphate isomerase [Waddliaceae bacterium]